MAKTDIYDALEKDFILTFIGELIPGILHNFANPLNGIMGRSKLLQRRIDDHVRKLQEKHPEAAFDFKDDLTRLQTDIRSVSSESETFFEMFKDVSAKFYALATSGEESISLPQLIKAEMRFSNFYLDFKHELKKEAHLGEEVPDIRGNLAELSLAFWRVIRFAMTQALASPERQFMVSVRYDHECVIVSIRYSGEAMPEKAISDALEFLDGGLENMSKNAMDHGVVLALVILNRYSARVRIDTQDGMNGLTVSIPYRNSKPGKGGTFK